MAEILMTTQVYMEHAHVAQMQRMAQNPARDHRGDPRRDPRDPREQRGDGREHKTDPRSRPTAYSNQEYMDHAHAAQIQRGREKQQSMDSGYPSSLERSRYDIATVYCVHLQWQRWLNTVDFQTFLVSLLILRN